MTDAEWQMCPSPTEMLEALRSSDKATGRKIRLFACAVCRHILPSIQDRLFHDVVEFAERFADGALTEQEMSDVRERALPAFVRLDGSEETAAAAALSAAGIPSPEKSAWDKLLDAFSDPWWEDEFDKGDPLAPALVTSRHVARAVAHGYGSMDEVDEQLQQADVARDIFGNPFQPSAPLLKRHDDRVVTLARESYQHRNPDGTLQQARLLALADALQQEGANLDAVKHLRDEKLRHYRGCWCIDMLTGRA